MKTLSAIIIGMFLIFATQQAQAEAPMTVETVDQVIALLNTAPDTGQSTPLIRQIGTRQTMGCCDPRQESCRTKNLNCASFGPGWHFCGETRCGGGLQGVYCCKN